MSDEARRNMSIAHLGIHPSKETRKRMSAAQTAGLKRKPISEIERLNMSRAQIGRKLSDGIRAKLRSCTLNEAAFDVT
jgi:hypothetical protein